MLNQESKPSSKNPNINLEIESEDPLADISDIKLEELQTKTELNELGTKMFTWLIESLILSTKTLLNEDIGFAELINLQAGLDVLEGVILENITTIEQQLDVIEAYTTACCTEIEENCVNYTFYDPIEHEFIIIRYNPDLDEHIRSLIEQVNIYETSEINDVTHHESIFDSPYVWKDQSENIVGIEPK